MQTNKILICPAFALALLGVSSVTSTTEATSAKFTGEVSVGLSASQQKSETKVSSSAVNSIIFSYSSVQDNLALYANANGIDIDHVIYKTFYDLLVQSGAMNNVFSIINRDNTDASIAAVEALKNYNKRLVTTTWTLDKNLVLGTKIEALVGVKFGNAALKVGGFVDFPFLNKKVNASVAKANGTNSNSSSNTSSTSSNSKVSLDIAEEKGLSWGFKGVAEISVTDRFTIGPELGIVRMKNSYDMSKPNKDLLGINGIPTGVDAQGKTDQDDVFKRSDDYKTYNKVEGAGWSPFIGMRLGWYINKCFSIVLSGGWRASTNLKLTADGKEIKTPDYNIKINSGFYGALALRLSV